MQEATIYCKSFAFRHILSLQFDFVNTTAQFLIIFLKMSFRIIIELILSPQ